MHDQGELGFFMGVVQFVVSIFCIILFFKIWGMTNSIKAIKVSLKKQNSDLIIARAIAQMDPDLENILYRALFEDLYKATKGDYRIDPIIKRYQKYYTRAGLEFPTEFKTMTNSAFASRFLIQ